MQSNRYVSRYKNPILRALKIAATLISLSFIAYVVSTQKVDWGLLIPREGQLLGVGLVLLLMPLNWWLEALRWRLAVPEERLSVRQSVNRVLIGLALNWWVPFTLGDAGGRLAGVENIKKAVSGLVQVRLISLLLTVGFGGMSVLYYFQFAQQYLVPALCALVALLFIAPFYISKINLRLLLHFSVIRYVVFTSQLFLLLYVFLPEIPPAGLVMGIGWIFLFRSVIPSLFGNFGVREASALVFFESFEVNPAAIIAPCVLVWLINTVLPSIVGALRLSQIKH
ncbi:lysylphosphatidylglycerol synthase-like protein [Marinoscillum furvescens DSM 4134]|uniref:Lysylphosphatidylglycerol synthase-like protein n=1 Tax=Marinoscillum furvescens DSM 4134 TaxID=1122208 RepID=A0A3D9LH57_MARFU|nr:lysylphosphatidylglycerol synthase-like protein [Marinoscillum furvescens DSM 4134]